MNQLGCFLILLTWNIKFVLSHWCSPKPRYGGKVLAWVSYKPGNLRKNRLKPSKARISKRKFCTNRNSTMLIFRCFQVRPVQISFTFNQLKCAKKILSKSLTPRQSRKKMGWRVLQLHPSPHTDWRFSRFSILAGHLVILMVMPNQHIFSEHTLVYKYHIWWCFMNVCFFCL